MDTKESPYTDAEIQKVSEVKKILQSPARNTGLPRWYFPADDYDRNRENKFLERRSRINKFIENRKNAAEGLHMTGPLQYQGGDLSRLITGYVEGCNEMSLEEETILMEAVSLGDVEVVEKVLEVCPNLDLHCNMRGSNGTHVLDFLRAHTPENQQKIITLLKAHGMYCSVNMCNEILVRILGPRTYKVFQSDREPFSLNNYIDWYDRISPNEYKKEEIMVAIALEQLECPRVDLDYRDQNGISIVEYAAARDIPRINQVIRRIRSKKTQYFVQQFYERTR